MKLAMKRWYGPWSVLKANRVKRGMDAKRESEFQKTKDEASLQNTGRAGQETKGAGRANRSQQKAKTGGGKIAEG